MLTRTTSRVVRRTYAVEGDTIIYTGPDGPENWKVRSFEPGRTLVVETPGVLSFLERR